MKCIIQVITIVFTAFLLAACNERSADLPEPGLPEEVRRIMSENRDNVLLQYFDDIFANFLTSDFDKEIDTRTAGVVRRHTTEDIISLFLNPSAAHQTDRLAPAIYREELVRDIYFLFDLLRYGYAGYQYFGGDNVFLPLRDSILERLEGINSMRILSYLSNLLVPSLQNIIADNHFIIQGRRMNAPNYVLFMNENFIIRNTENGYTVEMGGTIYKILETVAGDGQPVKAVLPTLTPQGEFARAFGRVASVTDFNANRITVLLSNIKTDETRSLIVSLRRVDPFSPLSHSQLEVHEAAGVTILENRCNITDNRQEAEEYFYRSGYLLRDKPILIIDLRAHRGGLSRLANAWMRGYTGKEQIHQLAFNQFVLTTFTSMELMGMGPSLVQGVIQEYEANPPKWRLPALPQHSRIQNENLVIVLVDKITGSAGECFIGYLRQLENVIFVGTNTAGTSTFGSIVGTRLPYSGLDIMFGVTLNLRSDLSKFEGVGFIPDLWVPPRESLERVLRFVERYGLAR